MDGARGYAGSESYRYIEPILKDKARELLVISPYIGLGYAKMLVGLARRKKVRVVTSMYSEIVREYIMHRSRSIVYSSIKAAAVLILCAVVAVYFSFYSIAGLLGIAVAILGLIGFVRYSQIRGANIEIRTSYEKFVHEKAYISEGIAAIGSANLTYSGLRKNVERVEIIDEPKRIAMLRAHFWDLWKACK